MSAKLIYKNISLLITQKPLRFVIILAGQIFAVLCILLVYGLSQNIYSDVETEMSIGEALEKLEISISLDYSGYSDESELPGIVGAISRRSFEGKINAFMNKFGDKVDYYSVGGPIYNINGKTYSGSALYCCTETALDSLLLSRVNFSYSQVSGGERIVNLNSDEFDKQSGDIININGNEYTVFYASDDYESIYSTYNSLPNDCMFKVINIGLKSEPTKTEALDIKETLISLFGAEDCMVVPRGYELVDVQFNTVSLAICVGVAVLVVFCVSFVYLYEIEQRRRTLAIFRYFGCSVENAMLMLLTEVLVIIILSFAFALGLFVAFGIPLVSEIIEDYKAFYTFGGYLGIFLGYLAISLLIFAAGIIEMLGKTAYETERKL